MAEHWRRVGAMRAYAPDDARLVATLGDTLDPDWVLTDPRCELRKLQRRVMVGRAVVGGRAVYVKRYNAFAARVLLRTLFLGSPARRAARAVRQLTALGFRAPDVVAIAERRIGPIVGPSFLVTDEVAAATTADVAWRAAAGDPGQRRRMVDALADLFARLHAHGVYHADLKDVNVLLPTDGGQPVLLDLERVIFGQRVSRRRREKNLLQLERTLGRLGRRTERLRFLLRYLGPETTRASWRQWATRVLAQARRKDRDHAPVVRPVPPGVSAMVVCQDEELRLGACLDSLAWCREIVVVDGGSRDRTMDVARAHGARVLENLWPGFREQKQFGLDACRMPWVFNVDADERVPHELAARVVREVARAAPDVDGLAVPRLVPYLGRWWFRGGWYPRRIVRVVRREATTWGGVNPHERPIVAGRVVALDEPLVHYSYGDTSAHLRTIRSLTRVTAARPGAPRQVGGGRLLGEPAWRFLRSWVLGRGLIDGLPGFFIAATDAVYVLTRWARVWERCHGIAGRSE